MMRSSIVWVIRSRPTRWAEREGRVGELRNISVRKFKGKRPLGRLGVGASIILKWIRQVLHRDRRWALVNMLVNRRVAYIA